MCLHDDWIMVLPIPTSNVIDFNSAYENICLIADKTWSLNSNNSYQRLNQCLWIQNVKWVEELRKQNIRVRDVIPESLLARYGNYEYNQSREIQYKSIEECPDGLEGFRENKPVKALKECLKKSSRSQITSRAILRPSESAVDSLTLTDDGEYTRYCPLPYSINSPVELALHERISSDSIRNLWSSTGIKPRKSFLTLDLSEEASGKKVVGHCKPCDEVGSAGKRVPRGLNKTTLPLLSAEVPEFFPKVLPARPETHFNDYLPPLSERYYQDKHILAFNRPLMPMFQNPGIPLIVPPLMTASPFIRSHQWIPRTLGPPHHPHHLQIQFPVGSITPAQTLTSLQSICPIIHRPIQLHEKVIQPMPPAPIAPIPVYQRPPELYQDPKRKSQGVDFNNLILLTKTTIKSRRNQAKNHQQTSGFILQSRQSSHFKVGEQHNVLQWIEKGSSKDFITIDSIVSDLRQQIRKSDIDFKSTGSRRSECQHDNCDNDDDELKNFCDKN